MSIDYLDIFRIFAEFSNLFPVKDVQVVMVVSAHAGFVWREASFNSARIHFCIERIDKGPSVRYSFTRIRQVLVVRREFQCQRLGLINPAFI